MSYFVLAFALFLYQAVIIMSGRNLFPNETMNIIISFLSSIVLGFAIACVVEEQIKK